MLERVAVTRYVTPLREGGSLPGIVEADDDGMYVLKFRGAGQGPKALVAEVIVTELARLLGLRVPRLAVVALPPAIARFEADEEVQDLLSASIGDNLGVDYLPGSFGYDGSRRPPVDEAAGIVWLDAYTANPDRTWANPNLLVWHREVYAIDHGAALWFHHRWPSRAPDPHRFAGQSFDATQHVLAAVVHDSDEVLAAHERLSPALDEAALRDIVDLVPDGWLEPAPGMPNPQAARASYVEHLALRLSAPDAWLPRRNCG